MNIPTQEECIAMMTELNIPPALLNHSLAVQKFALQLADELEAKGIEVNKQLVSAAALLHDVMKVEAEVCHCIEGEEFLKQNGFPEVGSIIAKHGLQNIHKPELIPKTTEEKLVMYADLRVSHGEIVSLEERFNYIKEKYPGIKNKFDFYLEFAKQLEQDLFKKEE